MRNKKCEKPQQQHSCILLGVEKKLLQTTMIWLCIGWKTNNFRAKTKRKKNTHTQKQRGFYDWEFVLFNNNYSKRIAIYVFSEKQTLFSFLCWRNKWKSKQTNIYHLHSGCEFDESTIVAIEISCVYCAFWIWLICRSVGCGWNTRMLLSTYGTRLCEQFNFSRFSETGYPIPDTEFEQFASKPVATTRQQ